MKSQPDFVCPQCGSTHGFRPVKMPQDNSGCLIFLLGGLLPYLIYNSGRGPKILCEHCDIVFVVVVVVVLLILLMISLFASALTRS